MTDDTLRLKVEKLASNGEGVAFPGGHVVFIPRTIPGEIVSCRITGRAKDYARAEPLGIENASPARVASPCSLFGICGGCTLQHIEYTKQIELKRESARESFTKIAGFDPGAIPISALEPYGYRNRAHIHLTADQGFGFMRSESNEAIRVPGCNVAEKRIDAWLRTENRKSNPMKEWCAIIGERSRFIAFSSGGKLYLEGRDKTVMVQVAQETYHFSTGHFFQSNLKMAGLLLDDIAAAIGHGEKAVDLYSGAGLFSKILAKNYDEVTCVESDAVAVESARSNVPTGKARFFPIDVDGWVEREAAAGKKADSRSHGRYELVVADPPRQGLSPKLRQWLKKADIARFIYISCDNATLARDLGELTHAGWVLESLKYYDFYPQTGRLEASASLVRGFDHSSGGVKAP
jgi:23S rRNA (uracil1939-C5)-methyltransferase